jgi:hypothetical protein
MGAGPDDLYPVDTIWLTGRGDNAGLSALLRKWSEGSGGAAVPYVEGWIFPTPNQG